MVERNKLIVKSLINGKSKKDVAMQFGLSKERIRQILIEEGLGYKQKKERMMLETQIISEYLLYATTKELQEKYSLSVPYILHKAGAAKQRRQDRNLKIAERYKQGASDQAIAALFNITSTTVRNVLAEQVLYTKRIRLNSAKLRQREKQIIALFNQEMCNREIAAHFGIHKNYVGEILLRLGFSAKQRNHERRHQHKLQILQYRQSGLRTKEIAARMGLKPHYIQHIIHVILKKEKGDS